MRRTRRRAFEETKLDMTPMIDCVFQLLIFFLVTMKFEDIIAHLDVYRPSPDPNAPPPKERSTRWSPSGCSPTGMVFSV